jgi:hypothetical protein
MHYMIFDGKIFRFLEQDVHFWVQQLLGGVILPLEYVHGLNYDLEAWSTNNEGL